VNCEKFDIISNSKNCKGHYDGKKMWDLW